MTSIAIRRMTNRFRMPAAAWPERARLGRIFETAMFDMLEGAVIDTGLDPRDEICIRDVTAFVRLRLRGTDQALARTWSEALARAIREATRASHPSVVTYRSRAQALADLVTSAARGDLSRAWAWATLGLWSRDSGSTGAARQVMRALIAHPHCALGVLGSAGRQNALEWLVKNAPLSMWIELAGALLLELTASEALLHQPPTREDDLVDDSLDEPRLVPDARVIARILGRSALAMAFVRYLPAIDDRATRGGAILVVAETEPWHFQDTRRAAAVVDAVAKGLVTPTHSDSVNRAWDANGPDQHVPTAQHDTSEDSGTPRVTGDQPDITEFGGLLFLIHVLSVCGLPRTITDDPALSARDLRWVLHQLAILLTGCETGDPAALAFAGLRPVDTPPDRDQPPLDERESEALSCHAQEIVERVAAVFADEEAREPLTIVKWLCERHADIVADAGWIEVRFRHEQADTSIRRRGLDLNPDFVPWLGIVVRFAYV